MSQSTVRVRFGFLLNRIREKLWVKPLLTCILSVIIVFVAKAVENAWLTSLVPTITADSLDSLLSIMASSMLVIATLAVTSMVAAYSSASNTASPRAFSLVVADDVSQRALSAFIGAFIFSIVSLIASKNGYFEQGGRFILFGMTIMVFALVILTFVRWVDRIARLGRMGNTIEKVEQATAQMMTRRKQYPTLKGVKGDRQQFSGLPVTATVAGYVQHIDMAALQAYAEKAKGCVQVAALPGSFITPGRVLAYVTGDSRDVDDMELADLASAFLIGNERVFDEDPRFGLIVLSQIAGRSLSPGVNDPGTAIDIIAILVRLFVLWGKTEERVIDPDSGSKVVFDRVEVPPLSTREMFDDAFTAIARDGSGSVEVAARLQKALASLQLLDDLDIRKAAKAHAQLALRCAEKALFLDEDIAVVKQAASLD